MAPRQEASRNGTPPEAEEGEKQAEEGEEERRKKETQGKKPGQTRWASPPPQWTAKRQWSANPAVALEKHQQGVDSTANRRPHEWGCRHQRALFGLSADRPSVGPPRTCLDRRVLGSPDTDSLLQALPLAFRK